MIKYALNVFMSCDTCGRQDRTAFNTTTSIKEVGGGQLLIHGWIKVQDGRSGYGTDRHRCPDCIAAVNKAVSAVLEERALLAATQGDEAVSA